MAFHWICGLPLARAEAVHALARHHVDAAAVDRERVLDVLAEPDGADPARLRVEDRDLAVLLRDEPDAAPEVGQRRADALVRLEDARQVVVVRLRDAAAVRGDLEHEQVARLRGAPDAVAPVEEEVAAAGEVLVRLRARRVGRVRHVVGGEQLERLRVDHPHLRRRDQRRADAHQVPARVERERPAQRRRHRVRERHGRAAQRPGPAVGVGHPGVVVDVAARVRRHEGVARRLRVAELLGGGRRALVPRQGGAERVEDRLGGRGGREREHDCEGQNGWDPAPYGHGAKITPCL